MEIKNPKLIKWLSWIDETHRETQNLLIKTYLYDQYVEIVKANKEIQDPRDFHDWSMHNYFDSALMCIRRITDTHKDAVSLMRLLLELKDNPELITKDFYLRDYQKGEVDKEGMPDPHAWTHALGDDIFKEKFGGGGNVLLASVVESDIQELEKQIVVVENFIDNTLAHRNKGSKGKQTLQTKDARAAIEAIEQTAIKYIDLMGRGSYGELTPVYQYNPEEIFLKPWIVNR